MDLFILFYSILFYYLSLLFIAGTTTKPRSTLPTINLKQHNEHFFLVSSLNVKKCCFSEFNEIFE